MKVDCQGPGRWIAVASLLGCVAAALPGVAGAANTCNGLFTVDYVGGPAFLAPGDIVRVRLTFGTGSVTGGTVMNLRRVRFDMDCNDNFSLGVPCTDEGMIVQYEGDATITTTCGVLWSSGHGATAVPNEIVFTPNVVLPIPANTPIPPGFCDLEFDVRVLAYSTDTTVNDIQETTGYLASNGDAMCDNGLASSSTQSASIPLCPNCDDGIDCSADSCDQNSGECINTPKPDSSTCTDTDDDPCTTAGCDGTLNSSPSGALIDGCDQKHINNCIGDDHYVCYNSSTVEPKPPDVTIEDQFETATFHPKRCHPKSFCAPASKNGGVVFDQDTHLKGYKIRRVVPAADPHVTVDVTNQFGTIRVTTRKADRLLVPSAKSLIAQPPQPDPLDPGNQHYKCYKIRVTSGSFTRQTVSVEDQFGTKQLLLKKVIALCNPARKNGSALQKPERHLLCYSLKPATKPTSPVFVTNQFGSQQVKLTREGAFCVPSTKTVVP